MDKLIIKQITKNIMEDNWMRYFAEKAYRELMTLECIPGFWASKHTIIGLFKIAHDDYKTLEKICNTNPNLRPLLDSAKSEIANLIHDYGNYVRTKKIGIIDRLELAIL